ncbi:MAG TPA: hypothetical protein VN310_18805 [Candidatus Dormibacteraeota bacterium]|nr:hypothetical protein [Candidatus Dormibacteraeota bacterium]
MPPPPPKKTSRFLVIAACVMALIGLIARVGIAAAILIRSYSFFEATVISLLILICCSLAMARGDAEMEKIEAKKKEPPDDQLMRSVLMIARGVAYGLIFLMAIAKLVFALLQ